MFSGMREGYCKRESGYEGGLYLSMPRSVHDEIPNESKGGIYIGLSLTCRMEGRPTSTEITSDIL